MNTRKKIILLALVSIFLCGAIWGVSWRRLHPPPTALDNQARKLLLSADRVDVQIENIELPSGSVVDFVTHLPPEETRSVTRYVNLLTEQPSTWGYDYVPCIYLTFFQSGKEQGSLSTSYSRSGFHHFFTDPLQGKTQIRRGLHPTTILRLRELIARHPEIMRALIKADADPKHLAPKSFADNLE